ncbi:MAG: hypothetical protein FWC39_07395 [Bacteroidetes bacterium]|nr:hypothetical protein [Bacteroidota bacterium]
MKRFSKKWFKRNPHKWVNVDIRAPFAVKRNYIEDILVKGDYDIDEIAIWGKHEADAYSCHYYGINYWRRK